MLTPQGLLKAKGLVGCRHDAKSSLLVSAHAQTQTRTHTYTHIHTHTSSLPVSARSRVLNTIPLQRQ